LEGERSEVLELSKKFPRNSYVVFTYKKRKGPSQKFLGLPVEGDMYAVYVNPYFLVGLLEKYSSGASSNLLDNGVCVLRIDKCTKDKELTQLREVFIPMHDEILSTLNDNFLLTNLLVDVRDISLHHDSMFNVISEKINELNKKKNISRSQKIFLEQAHIESGFSLVKLESLKNEVSSDIEIQDSKVLRMGFSFKTDTCKISRRFPSLFLSLGVDYLNSQFTMQGAFEQNVIYDGFSEVYLSKVSGRDINDRLSLNAVEIPIMMGFNLLEGRSGLKIGLTGGLVFSHLVSGKLVHYNGTLDFVGYSNQLQLELDNSSEYGFVRGYQTGKQTSDLNIDVTRLNPEIGIQFEQNIGSTQSIAFTVKSRPFYQISTNEIENGLISNGINSYNGILNSISDLKTGFLLVGISVTF
jgi:hypothetical protein